MNIVNTFRRTWRRLLLVLSALIIIVVAVVETSHFLRWRHFVWFGLHAHVLRQSAEIGIPGINTQHAVFVTNYSPFQTALTGCKGPSDISPYYEIVYRFEVDRWDTPTRTWRHIVSVPPSCPSDDLTIVMLRPWETIQMHGWDAIGATDGFEKGDEGRIVVFTSFNETDNDRQRRIVSPSFLIEDHYEKAGISYRLKD